MVYIERLQVDAEGFLANLDLHFSPGLNVVIGARGTGKTSIVELVRFALGAGSFTKDAGERGEQQARAILDGGQVTVTLRDGETELIATRSASMAAPRLERLDVACTVLAQNEVEAVGAQRSGRLMLIDRFRQMRSQSDTRIVELEGRVRGLTREIADSIREVEALVDFSSGSGTLRAELDAARLAQRGLLENSQATKPDQERLQRLQAASQVVAARADVLLESSRQSKLVAQSIQEAVDLSRASMSAWPSEAGPDVLIETRATRDKLVQDLARAILGADAWQRSIDSASEENDTRRASIEAESRELRQSLDLFQAGASQSAQRVAELEERVGQVAAIESRKVQREEQLGELVKQRDSAYFELEKIWQSIFDERREVAEDLNRSLGPNIRVSLKKSAGTEEYRNAIINAIRGTGLHYNTLGPLIAAKVSPFELITWAETSNTIALATAVDIGVDRAALVLQALRSSTPDIITSRVSDEVELALLDGQDYKSTDRLSIGQRCTVVLPLLLGHAGDPLLLDQPEDHLDNAFVADTLVAALRRRGPEDQYIFASHNANIPVLGNADRVIVMGSDGDRGFATAQGSLDDLRIVESIESLMEGGVEAFETRSLFYASQGQR